MLQTIQKSIGRRLLLGTFSFGIVIGAATQAHTQGFISPMLGANFGGVSGCPQLNGCKNEQTNLSLSVGKFGTFFGAETEVAYSPKFFGEADGLSSNVLTVMGNVMLGPKAGPVRPFILAGLGVMKTNFELRTSSVLTTNDTAFGYNVGAGVVALVSDHFGLRGDARYFHSFPDVAIAGFTLASTKLNYSRVSAGVVITF